MLLKKMQSGQDYVSFKIYILLQISGIETVFSRRQGLLNNIT